MSDALVSYGTYYSYLSPVNSGKLYSFDIPECDVTIKKFNDGEISVKFNETLRGKHLFVFGETTRNLTELILTLDAAKRASVREVTVVLPYFGYSRQDKREGTRGCIGAKAISHVIEAMGVDRVVSVDLHAAQIQGYFQVPFEHLSGVNLFEPIIRNLYDKYFGNITVCSPDAGGVARAAKFAALRNLPLVTINKRRDRPGEVSSMELSGDVRGRAVIVIDDIADTCGTLVKASEVLRKNGATQTYAIATHAIFSGDALHNLGNSTLQKIYVSNTVGHRERRDVCNPNAEPFSVEVLDCSSVLHIAMHRISSDLSLSDLN